MARVATFILFIALQVTSFVPRPPLRSPCTHKSSFSAIFSEPQRRRVRKDRAQTQEEIEFPPSSDSETQMRQTTSLDDTSSLPSLPTFPSSAPDDLSTLLADAEKFRSKSPKKTGDEAVGDAIGQSIKGVIRWVGCEK